MIAFDTNILFPALESSHSDHASARSFLQSLDRQEGVICELVLMEVYVLIRNPKVCRNPLSSSAAVTLIQKLRTNPAWRLVDYPGGLMAQVWKACESPGFARRRVFDARLAVCLRHHGVAQLATANVSDFEGFGFDRVWNPLSDSGFSCN